MFFNQFTLQNIVDRPGVLSCTLLFKQTQVRYFGNMVPEMYTTQRDYNKRMI